MPAKQAPWWQGEVGLLPEHQLPEARWPAGAQVRRTRHIIIIRQEFCFAVAASLCAVSLLGHLLTAILSCCILSFSFPYTQLAAALQVVAV